MKDFCENQYCESPGAKVVPVSVSKPSDQRRTLCAPCEEAYTWGVQHGTITAQAKPARPQLDRFLKKDGFVILTRNDGDPSRHGPFEAWAYRGPLDLQTATPVTFGVGTSVPDALDALELQLESERQHVGQGKQEMQLDRHRGSWRVHSTPPHSHQERLMPKKNNTTTLRITCRELATILAALRFHQNENLQGSPDIPDQFIKEIATDGGLFKPLTFEEVSKLCERLNTDDDQPAAKGLVIEPPHKEGGVEPLFRIVYVIDVNAASPLKAAKQAYRIMADSESQPPVLDVIDHRGKTVSIDLSQEAPA